MQRKSKIRSQLLKRRMALSDLRVQKYSEKIVKKLIDYVSWNEIKNINTYQTLKSKSEINISALLDFLSNNYPNIQIDIAESKISSAQRVPEGNNYDLVIVPLVGFDRNGNRLGYGGGYYDKFLAVNNCNQTIGLAYSFQEVEELPVEEHDQKLDLIITEKEVIKL